MTSRVAVLASGSGSNLQSLLDYLNSVNPDMGDRAAEIVLVASNRADAPALDRGRAAGVATSVLSNPDDGTALTQLLEDHAVDLVVLAGYLKLVPALVVNRFAGWMLNVHPALLPSFGGPGMYGRRVHEAVLKSGARVTGVTVHFVDEQFDRGSIVAQWPVPVLPGDDAASLAARVLRAEHIIYPRVVESVAAGRLDEHRRTSHSPSHPLSASASSIHFALTVDPAAIAAGVDDILSI